MVLPTHLRGNHHAHVFSDPHVYRYSLSFVFTTPHRLHHVDVATLTSPLPPPRTTATIFGRHAYFKKVVMRMWGRFLPSRWMKTIEGKK